MDTTKKTRVNNRKTKEEVNNEIKSIDITLLSTTKEDLENGDGTTINEDVLLPSDKLNIIEEDIIINKKDLENEFIEGNKSIEDVILELINLYGIEHINKLLEKHKYVIQNKQKPQACVMTYEHMMGLR